MTLGSGNQRNFFFSIVIFARLSPELAPLLHCSASVPRLLPPSTVSHDLDCPGASC